MWLAAPSMAIGIVCLAASDLASRPWLCWLLLTLLLWVGLGGTCLLGPLCTANVFPVAHPPLGKGVFADDAAGWVASSRRTIAELPLLRPHAPRLAGFLACLRLLCVPVI